MNKKELFINKPGFTLMELVTVVAILGVLFLLLLLVLNPRSSILKAYDAHRKKDLEDLKIAFENYYTDTDCYPTQQQINNCLSADLDPYLKEIPCDPVSNIPYELIGEPTVCPQNFIAYAELKRPQDPNADGFNCASVSSPNAVKDPAHNCAEYFSNYTPTGTPTPTPTGTPPPTPTGTPTPTPTGTPTPTPTPTSATNNYYACSPYNPGPPSAGGRCTYRGTSPPPCSYYWENNSSCGEVDCQLSQYACTE